MFPCLSALIWQKEQTPGLWQKLHYWKELKNNFFLFSIIIVVAQLYTYKKSLTGTTNFI